MYPNGSVAPVRRDDGGGRLERDELLVPLSTAPSVGVVAAVSPLIDLPVPEAEADADPGDDVEVEDRLEDRSAREGGIWRRGPSGTGECKRRLLVGGSRGVSPGSTGRGGPERN